MNTMPNTDAYAAGYAACRDGAPLSPPSELDADGANEWGNGWIDCLLAMMLELAERKDDVNN